MQGDVAKSAAEWVFVARSLGQLPDSQSLALRCLSRAGTSAQDVADWLALARAWAKDFNDLALARQCIAKAEALAEESEDDSWDDSWTRIADIWVEMGNDSQAIEIFRERFELGWWWYFEYLQWHMHRDLNDRTSWIDWLVESAREEVTNYSYALRYLVEAEKAAESASDWVRIAVTWHQVFQNSDCAVYCMDQAEGTDYDGWMLLAKVWKRHFGNLDNYNRCVREAWDSGGDNLSTGIDSFIEDAELDLNTLTSRAEGAIVDLGDLTDLSVSRFGAWSDECVSKRRPESFARYYSFTVSRKDRVSIYLTSNLGAYLYLVDGAVPCGDTLAEDSNDIGGRNGDTLCQAAADGLAPGTYSIEAATYHKGEGGVFNLTVYPF